MPLPTYFWVLFAAALLAQVRAVGGASALLMHDRLYASAQPFRPNKADTAEPAWDVAEMQLEMHTDFRNSLDPYELPAPGGRAMFISAVWVGAIHNTRNPR